MKSLMVSTTDTFLDDYSPTYEALLTIYEVMESDTKTFKSYLYAGTMVDSGASHDIIMESISDVFNSIVEGIREFIKKIKEFFKKILMYITTATEDLDKVAAKVKPLINDTDIKFTIDGYKFTVMEKSAPNMNEFSNIVSSYNDDMDRLDKLKEKEIKAEIENWLNESNLDKLRGQVLGSNQSIPEDDYLEEIRSYYRNGEKDSKTIDVTKSMVNDIISKAKRLEDLKKSSIKDRDQLVTLLTKTESFFNRTIVSYYKGNDKQMNLNKVDISDNKFSTKDNYVKTTEDSAKIATRYATMKAKQVNKIASMINLVACERVNALRDQIKQERVILRKCLFSDNTTKDKVSESIEIFPKEVGYNGSPYSILSMESAIQDYRVYDRLYRTALLEEAKFVSESIKMNEVHYLMEADTTKLSGQIKNTIDKIIDAVTKAFREKAMGNTEKYKPWIADIRPGIKEKAKAKKEFNMAGFLDSDYNAIATKLSTAISSAYKSTNYTDVSFASNLVPEINSFDKLKDTGVRTLLLNYFRTGNANEKLDTKKMNGAELSGKVDAMMKYVESYSNVVSSPVEKISNSLKSASNNFKGVTESMITGTTYISLIESTICESDIVSCVDYNMMFDTVTESLAILQEAGDVKIGNSTNTSEVNKSVKQTANAASNETGDAKEITKATQVSDVDDPNAKKAEEGIPEKKTNAEAVAYKKAIDAFFRNCLTLYLQAREEQFIAYVNALAAIDGSKPKFDKNGKYITKEEAKKESKDATKVEGN